MAVDMRDRLIELRGVNKIAQEDDSNGTFDGLDLDDCFSQVDKVSKATHSIEELFDKLPSVYKSVLTTMGGQKEDAVARHTELTNRVKDLYKIAISGLKRLEIEIKSGEGGPERFSAEFRIKKSQFSTLSRNLKRVMMEYNSMETDHREEMKEMVKRKLKTAGSVSSGLSEDEIEEMVESKDSIFTQNILIDTASKRKDLEEVDRRKREMMKLEENILELNEMFFDMMLLVDEQGDLVDNIENNVDRTAGYVSKGTQNTAIANKYSKKNRTLKWIIVAVILVVAGVLLIVIGIIVAAVIGIQSGN